MPPNVNTPSEELPIREIYEQHWWEIRTRQSRKNRAQDWYNYRLEGYDRHVFEQQLRQILNDQTTVFRLNLSFGYMLRNTETGALQYYHASANNHCVFDKPFLVSNAQPIEHVLDEIHNLDIEEWVRQ